VHVFVVVDQTSTAFGDVAVRVGRTGDDGSDRESETTSENETTPKDETVATTREGLLEAGVGSGDQTTKVRSEHRHGSTDGGGKGPGVIEQEGDDASTVPPFVDLASAGRPPVQSAEHGTEARRSPDRPDQATEGGPGHRRTH
jgi:hypothetical protein